MKTILLTITIVAAPSFCVAAPAAQTNSPAPVIASAKVGVVETEAGKVHGYIHHGIYTFRDIPYAKAARFMPPEQPDHWEGVRSTMAWGFICPQVYMEQLNDRAEFLLPHVDWGQSEDCLNLNIWTPALDGKKRPVMVWFHGGGFSIGSSIEQVAYDGENLSRKGDVVVVTVNHRLNVLGYLDLSAYGTQYKYSGNVGIMDLVAALQWVKSNIANFGGDPSNVTIFGQSGGGGKVNALMEAPAAKGLFQRAIVESGAARGMGMTLPDQKVSRRVAALTLQNLHLDPSQVDQLETIPFRKLYDAGQKALAEAGKERGNTGLFGSTLMWAPVYDEDYIPDQPFDTAAPEISKNVPLMIGTTLNEFSSGFSGIFNPKTKDADSWSMGQLKAYFREQYGDKADEVMAEYRKTYPGMKPTDWLHVDTFFRPGAIIEADLKADQHGAPVYNYVFAWQSPVLDGTSRASHCAEIPFVFDNIALDEAGTGGGKDAYVLANKVSQAWINFARSGNPNSPDSTDLPHWPAYTRGKGAVMIFNNKSEVRDNFDLNLMKLLNPNLSF